MKEKNRGISPQLNSSSNSAVTQPVGDPRNVRRNQQIKALHLEFQDLKKKIKDVESKNEKIIENIHKQYDFKKKPQASQYLIETTPVVHYEEQQEKSNPTVERSSNSDHSDGDYKGRPVIKKNSNIKKSMPPAFHQSIEYRKTEHSSEERDQSEVGSNKNNGNPLFRPPLPASNQFTYSAGSQYAILPIQPQQQFQISQFSGLNPYQVSMQYPAYNHSNMASSQVGSYYGQNTYQAEEALKRQRQKIKILQHELQERQQDMVAFKKLQKNYNETIELCFQQFFDEVIKKRLYEIDKYVKKNENKLKKIQLKLKDREEDEKSRKIIEEHRNKRSCSRSKRQNSPRQNYNSLTNVPKVPSKRTNQSITIPNDTSSKSKQSEQSKSSQQFEEIATQYQQMIKTKTKEIEAYELRLRQKDKQLIEMSAKCSKLQMKIADSTSNSAQKQKKTSKKEQNLLQKSDYSNNGQRQAQILSLTKKISELEDQLQGKNKQLTLKDAAFQKNNKKVIEYEAKIKKSELEVNKLKDQYKKIEKQFKTDSNTVLTIKKLEGELQVKEKQYILLKEKSTRLENEKIQKQCQNLTTNNKLKKIESLLLVKQQKITELEKIIQSNVGNEAGGDLLEKSMYLQKIDHNDLHNLQEEKERLDEQLIKQREQIFLLLKNNQHLDLRCKELEENSENLKKEIQTILIHNQSMRITLKAQQFQKYKVDLSSNPLQKLLEEGDCVSQNDEDHLIRDELEELKVKYEETQSLLKIQNQKTFQQNRKVLKLTSELNYFKDQLSQRQDKYEKLRKQYEQNKCQISFLNQNLQEKESELEVERKVNAEKIKQIESQWLQFQQQVRTNQNEHLDTSRDQDMSELRNSRHFSEESFINYKNTYNNVNAQNERLMEKMKQYEKVVEVQKEMQDKIVNQYRSNVEKIKGELREKIKDCERTHEENQNLKRRVRVLEQSQSRLRELAKGDEEENLLGSSTPRVVQLQMELNEMREINCRLQAVEQQLFNQISQKQKEVQGILKSLCAKERRIEELQDIIELKEMNFSSHISNSQHRSKIRESMQSQSSLRYSMLSNNRDKTMELELSEAGESFFDQNQSMISNVSEVFGRDEFPYEKMQLKRVEQRRLFQKTAAYIKSLKHAIEEKNKKIKILERKIESLRNSELIRKDIYEIKQASNYNDFEPDSEDIFKDYYSVQLESSHSQRYKFKQLQHETKLTIEQNNLLNNQIENMQEEILKAEEQENSLMKLKDLYKDEIKNLIKQNQDQMKVFEEEVKKERQKVEQSESVQKMEALKQIFVKIINVFTAIEVEGSKSKKKEEKKKELQDYLKVCFNLMNFDAPIREQLLGGIRQIKR